MFDKIKCIFNKNIQTSSSNELNETSQTPFTKLENSSRELYFDLEKQLEDSCNKLRFYFLGEKDFIETLRIQCLSTQEENDAHFDINKVPSQYKTKGQLNQIFFDDFNERVIKKWNDFLEETPNNEQTKDSWLKFIKKQE